MILAHLAYEFFPELRRLPSIGQLLEPAGLLGFGGYYLLWKRGKTHRIETAAVFFILMPLEIFTRFQNLFLTKIMLLLIFIIFLLWREKQFKTLASFFVLILAVMLLFPASTHLRAHRDSTLEKFSIVGKGVIETIFRGKLLGENYLIDPDKTYLDGRLAPLVRRLSQVWVFHHVYNQSPDPVPYWNGTSYRPLLTSFIPRAIYPNKPEERSGYAFGTRYGMVEPSNVATSANIPWITEMLANFGPWVVIFGMSLAGVLLAFLDRVFNQPAMSDLEFVVGLTLIFPLVYPESNFSVMTGSMLPLFFSLFVYFYAGAKIFNRLRSI